MTPDDPNRTVPRTPPAEKPTDDTKPRVGEESSADPNRTSAQAPSGSPAGTGTVARTPSDAARHEPSAQAQAAEGVLGYVLLGELGRGGMGVVYKARHLKLNRVVALKMMLGGERVGRSDLIRFLAEAEAVAAVKHENVVQVYDYGEADDRPYMALEFCPGGTLGGLLAKGRESVSSTSSARDAAKLITQVARGVAAAHALGIVHRDLKPGNVFLDDAGVPKVADFGLAKRGEGSDVTQAGTGMGTPAYMAPEQARDAKFVGPQADVWALGVMLYESLTGTRPFTGTVQEILAKAQNATPIPPRKSVSTVPRDLELICLKCLSKQPHERYATAKELADDLDRYARGEPTSVRPAGPLERGHKWVKRNKVVSAAAAAVSLALLVGAGVSLAFGLEARDQAKNAKAASENEEKEKVLAIAARNGFKEKNDELIRERERGNRILAKALLAPITVKNSDKPLTPLTPLEVDTFWQIAELRRDGVPLMFLEEATRTPLACEQFECRAEYALHAAIGLDPDHREAANRLFLGQLTDPGARKSKATGLAVAISRSDFASPNTVTVLAHILADALVNETNSFGGRHPSRQLASELSAVMARVEPTEAVRILTDAAAKMTVANAREYLYFTRPGVRHRRTPGS